MNNFPCKNCMPPERHPGCHSTCEDYLRAKKKHDRDKAERDFIRKGEYDTKSVNINAALKTRKRKDPRVRKRSDYWDD